MTRIVLEALERDGEPEYRVWTQRGATEAWGELRTRSLTEAYAELMAKVTRGDLFERPATQASLSRLSETDRECQLLDCIGYLRRGLHGAAASWLDR